MSDSLQWADESTRDLICPLKRSKASIVWTCLSTVLICSWTSVHPNIPPRNEWMARANRLKLMFWMIIAPELVLAWAARQYFAAREIRDKFNEGITGWKKWTVAHGHFFGMGGFIVVDSSRMDDNPEDVDQDGEVLTFPEYETRFKNHSAFSLPTLTHGQIKDRSKADDLAKAIALLQTLWFIIQCIARRHQRLVLTELELVTVALASLNFFTFVIWLDKPLDVKEPIRIYVQKNLTPTPTPSTTGKPAASMGSLVVTGPVITANSPASTPGTTGMTGTSGPTSNEAAGDSLELSVRYVISEAFKLLMEAPIALYRPCPYPEEFLIYLIIILPLNIYYIATFPVYVLFPLGIVLLLNVIETKRVDDEDGSGSFRIATRMLKTLQSWRYKLALSIRGPFGRRFRNSFRDRGFIFFWSWFLLFPSMFFLLLLFIVFFGLFSFLVFFFSFIFNSAFDIITTREALVAPRVPPFYALETKSDKFSRMLVFALFGVLFGGIHLFARGLVYPTNIEKILWWATSLSITTIPIAVAFIDCVLENVAQKGGFVKDALDLTLTILLVIYVLARLTLIVQALALLRDPPLEALLVVDWTGYIHIFS